MFAIRRQHFAQKRQRAIYNLRRRGNGRAAGTVQRRQKAAFRRHRDFAGGDGNFRQYAQRRHIIGAARQGQCTLTGRGRHLVIVEQGCDMAGQPKPGQSCQRQESGVYGAFFQFAQPRLDAAAQDNDFQVGPKMQRLGLAAQAGGADHGALRQIPQRFGLVGNESVAGVFTMRHRRQHNAIGQPRRQVLHRMHRRVDAPVQQGFIQLLGEEPFAAGILQPLVLEPVAAGDEALQREIRFGQVRCARQQCRHHAALGQSQR